MWRYFRHFITLQKKYVISFIIGSIIISALILRRGFQYGDMFQSLIDGIKNQDQSIFLNALFRLIWIELLLFFSRIVVIDVIKVKCRWYMNLAIRLFWVDKVVEMNYQNSAKLGSGKLFQIIHSGMESYSYLIYDGLQTVIEVGISLIAIFILLSSQSLWFVLIILVFMAIVIGLQKVVFTYLHQARARDVILNESYTKQTAKILMNFILLKIYNIKEHELNTLREIGTARVDNYQLIKFRFNGIASTANFFFLLLQLGALRYLGFYSSMIDTKLIFVLVTLFTQARSELYRFGLFLAEIGEKMTYIQRFDQVITQSQQHNSIDNNQKKSIWPLSWAISYKDVNFAYEGVEELLFEWLDLNIPSWQKLAIIGKSGSGKSTLFKLLSKMLDPTSGKISIGKQDINTIPIEQLYRHIGYFYQEPLVFDGTLEENITLNAPIDEDKINNAISLCQLDHLSPDTVIGEHGVLLSGGEKQRLALARAFVFDYDILLLDEPTSNLDPELEQSLLLALFDHYKYKTIIVISHRPFILDFVDRVLIMKKWMIVSDGPRKSLKNIK